VLAKLFTGKIDSPEGQGVGLLIAQAIVETYGGKLEAQNLPQGGAEFLIRLPLHF
jgi:signal transduction histidine kinase